MAWLRLDDRFGGNPKITELSDREFRVWIETLLYCAANKTDGKLSKNARVLHLERCRERFLKLGLLDVVDDGDFVHDWPQFNPKDPDAASRMARLRAERKANIERTKTEHDTEQSSVSSRTRARTRVPVPVPLEKSSNEDSSTTHVADLPALNGSGPERDDVQRVYDRWRAARGKSDARYGKLSEGRRAKIQARLREFSADDLCRALDAVSLDDWDGRAGADDLTQLFRSRERVDHWLELAAGRGVDPTKLTDEQRKALADRRLRERMAERGVA